MTEATFPTLNGAGDHECPKCGHDDVATWSDDGESWAADHWQCESFSGGCGAFGDFPEWVAPEPQPEPVGVCPCGGTLDRFGHCTSASEAAARMVQR